MTAKARTFLKDYASLVGAAGFVLTLLALLWAASQDRATVLADLRALEKADKERCEDVKELRKEVAEQGKSVAWLKGITLTKEDVADIRTLAKERREYIASQAKPAVDRATYQLNSTPGDRKPLPCAPCSRPPTEKAKP